MGLIHDGKKCQKILLHYHFNDNSESIIFPLFLFSVIIQNLLIFSVLPVVIILICFFFDSLFNDYSESTLFPLLLSLIIILNLLFFLCSSL